MKTRVLIVEDNELMAQMYRALLGPLGCSVSHARTVQEARQLLHRVDADLFIIDDRLSDGSGADVARSVRAFRGGDRARIIATTSRPMPRDMTGRETVVVKPIQPGAFAALVQRCLGPVRGTAPS